LEAGSHQNPQRIWPSSSDGFYVQMQTGVAWWKTPPPGEPLAQAPAIHFKHPLLEGGSPCAFAEDPISRRVFIVSQWRSHYVVLDRDTGAEVASGRVTPPIQGAFHTTPDVGGRRSYLSDALGNGSLYQLDLDSLALAPIKSSLFMYETVIDPAAQRVWGAQLMAGQVVGVDLKTMEIAARFPTGFGGRELQRDPRSGTLYSCGWFGDIFRLDVGAQREEKIGWCGRLCRNLHLDTERDTLWVATDDGICRIALDGSSAPATRE
jgi:hypothetical protein